MVSVPKRVQFPRGTAEQEEAITGLEGEIRFDTTRNTLRVHDGVTPGGHQALNEAAVQRIIAVGSEGFDSDLLIVTNESELAGLPVSASTLAIVNGSGIEGIYVWRAGAGDDGTVASVETGHWRHIDSHTEMAIKFWRLGLMTMQIGGVAPVASQDTTAWLDSGAVKLYNGSAYVAATPALWARLWASIGSYATGAGGFPDRLKDTLQEITDLDVVTETGWGKTFSGDGNNPTGLSGYPVHTYYDTNTGMQLVYNLIDIGGFHARSWNGSVWSAWTYHDGALPERLGATLGSHADANTAIDSGFYFLLSGASNIPVAADGYIVSSRYASTEAMQTWTAQDMSAVYRRSYIASAWGAWSIVFPLDFSNVTGTVPVNQGGTGAVTAAAARTALGTEIDIDVQGHDPALDLLEAVTPTLDNTLVGTGAGWIMKTAAQMRTLLGLVIGTDVLAEMPRTGVDTGLVTGTADTANRAVMWNIDGDAVGGGIDVDSDATLSEMEAGTIDDGIVTPAIAQYHRSACSVWVNGVSNNTYNYGYNIISATDHGTGDFSYGIGVSWESNGECAYAMTQRAAGTVDGMDHRNSGRDNATTVALRTTDSSGAATNRNHDLVAFGDLV